MNISSETKKYLAHPNTDDKYSKSKVNNNKLKTYNDITNSFIDKLKIYISNIKEVIIKSVKDNKDKYNKYIDDITRKLEKLFINYINSIKNSYDSQYDNILRLYEQKIRKLYENIFNLELNKKILEESNKNLLRKEKEYELIKQKTGVIIMNGKIINNSRKENEIFILRKENSILKDIIEKQKQEFLLKDKKTSKEKTKLNTRLIIKMNDLSLKNKKNTKNLYDSISPRVIKTKKINHSNPQSNYRFKSDFISQLNQSLLKSKLNNSYKSIINYPSSKSCIIKNIFNIFKKNKNNYKYNNNYINIKSQNNNIKRKVSPQKAIKKRVIPKIRKNNFHSLNKKKMYKQFLERNNKHRYKSTNPSTIGISVSATQRDTNIKDNYSLSRKKNHSESLNKKKINLLHSSIIKTLNNRTNKYKKGMKYINLLSPSNDNMVNLISKMKSILNLRKHKSKYSNSFTMKNNNKNLNNNYNIKRIIFSKRDNSKINSLNIINNKKNKNISDKKSNNRYNTNAIKTSNSLSKKNFNNINSTNNTINISKIKKIIKNKS